MAEHYILEAGTHNLKIFKRESSGRYVQIAMTLGNESVKAVEELLRLANAASQDNM